MWIIVEEQKNEITQYLLGELDEAGAEQMELRLLSDPDFSEEFDVVVDEIAIRYAAGGFEGKERDRVERHFLRARERQDKARVMCELLHRSASSREEKPLAKEPAETDEDSDSGLMAGLRRFWSKPLVPQFALTLATVAIVVGLVFWLRSGGPAITNYATLTLAASEADRGQPGEEVKSVKLSPENDGLRIQLLLPAQQAPAKTYRVEFVPSAGQNATVVSNDAQSVVVTVPAADLKRDRYAIRLFAVYADGREERIPGSYFFRVE